MYNINMLTRLMANMQTIIICFQILFLNFSHMALHILAILINNDIYVL